MNSHTYQLLANCVLAAHLGLVVFIVGGVALILLGGRYNWPWVRNFWFRVGHLAAISYVVAESWVGIMCPLTTLEQWLRTRAGEAGYADDFIAHWLGSVLFYTAPPWVFTAAYSAFAVLIALSWIAVRPSRRPPKP